jgi:hypothetical protein
MFCFASAICPGAATPKCGLISSWHDRNGQLTIEKEELKNGYQTWRFVI